MAVNQIATALENVTACRSLVDDYSNRLDDACTEYYETGKTGFPNLSRAESEDITSACLRALDIVSVHIPDARSQWDSIKYPSDQYDETVECQRDFWVRKRNLFRSFESILTTRNQKLDQFSSDEREGVARFASEAAELQGNAPEPGFLKRDWTESEKWGMGILSALLIAAVITTFTWVVQPNEFENRRARALLLGYDGALALASSQTGESIVQQKSQIDGHLGLLGIKDISYPSNPMGSVNDAAPAAEFAKRVAGRLRSEDERLDAAFILGWYGVISTNSPSLKLDDFDVRRFAVQSGYPEQSGNFDEAAIVERLVKKAKAKLRN